MALLLISISNAEPARVVGFLVLLMGRSNSGSSGSSSSDALACGRAFLLITDRGAAQGAEGKFSRNLSSMKH